MVNKKHKVIFKEDGKEVVLADGKTILDALFEASIAISSICGGAGRCGKCKVQVKKGGVSQISDLGMKFLPQSEIEEGFCLACQTAVKDDIEVSVPETSRILKPQILTKSEYVIGEISPRAKRIELKLEQPSLADNVSDFTRVRRELRKYGIPKVTCRLEILRKLPALLRSNDWTLNCTLMQLEDTLHEIIDVNLKKNYGIAIDIGTTTVVAELVDLENGSTVASAATYNKQVLYGEDILSRITHADTYKDGLHKLSRLTVETINYLIQELVQKADIQRSEIVYMVVAGNTTMMHFLYCIQPTYLRLEPYIPAVTSLPLVHATTLGIHINRNAYVYAIPGRSSYVGGDITADILAASMHTENDLCLLIDVGTNGEVVLGNKDWLVSCSCSAGPAFEGGEVDCGMRAMEGAIERVDILPNLETYFSTIGDIKPRGICGSGLIDLLAEMFYHGIIDKSGKIVYPESKYITDGTEGKEFIIVPAEKAAAKKNLTISEVDIRNIIRTKAAVYAACALLTKTFNYTFSDITKIFIAGGFGNYLNLPKAILLGLFPDVPSEKYVFIGNGAVAGAKAVLLSTKKQFEAEEIARRMTYIELSVSSAFFDEFTSALFLPHTNIELFPTVQKLLKLGRVV